MADINIYGKLKNNTTDGVLADASQIKDIEKDKFQSDINSELQSKIESVEEQVEEKVGRKTDPNSDSSGEIFNDYENNTASGSLSHAEGFNCHAIGENSHAEGSNNMAEGNCSHAEGTYNETYGKNSHAEGEFNTTDGDSSHAEGGNNSVNGNYSHVEGDNNEVSGSSSHVEGSGNICNEANCCHVEGTDNTARGNCSHVEGTSNTSTIENQHIEGQYSKESNSIHIVGIGTSGTNRKNAHEITLEGKHYIPNIGGYDGTNRDDSKSLQESLTELNSMLESKQDKLVSGTNIKTINGTSLLGTGDIEVGGVNVVQTIGDSQTAVMSQKAVTDELNKKGSELVTIEGGTPSTSLDPGKYYKFGTCTTINITELNEGTVPDYVSEYMFEFTSGDTPTVLTLPETVKWIGDSLVDNNKTYQVSIVNNIAVMGGA